MNVHSGVLHAIGRTPIVRLGKVVPPNCADIFVKLERENSQRLGLGAKVVELTVDSGLTYLSTEAYRSR